MTAAIGLEDLLKWNEESAAFWKEYLDTHAELLSLPCDIGGAIEAGGPPNVQGFVRHIWSVELRWVQRIAGLPLTGREDMPQGPLDALLGLHTEAMKIARRLLDDPAWNWDETMTLDFAGILPPHLSVQTYRKVMAHMLFHSQRHWAQLTTLARHSGFSSGFRGDLIFSSAVR